MQNIIIIVFLLLLYVDTSFSSSNNVTKENASFNHYLNLRVAIASQSEQKRQRELLHKVYVLSEKEIRTLIEDIGLSPEEIAKEIGATGASQVKAWQYGRAYPESRFLTYLEFLRDLNRKRRIVGKNL